MKAAQSATISRKRLAPKGFVASRVYGSFRTDKMIGAPLPHRFRPGKLDPRRCAFCTWQWDTDVHV